MVIAFLPYELLQSASLRLEFPICLADRATYASLGRLTHLVPKAIRIAVCHRRLTTLVPSTVNPVLLDSESLRGLQLGATRHVSHEVCSPGTDANCTDCLSAELPVTSPI
jgi:hypothetical protein